MKKDVFNMKTQIESEIVKSGNRKNSCRKYMKIILASDLSFFLKYGYMI